MNEENLDYYEDQGLIDFMKELKIYENHKVIGLSNYENFLNKELLIVHYDDNLNPVATKAILSSLSKLTINNQEHACLLDDNGVFSKLYINGIFDTVFSYFHPIRRAVFITY